jgi:hypothetical protein
MDLRGSTGFHEDKSIKLGKKCRINEYYCFKAQRQLLISPPRLASFKNDELEGTPTCSRRAEQCYPRCLLLSYPCDDQDLVDGEAWGAGGPKVCLSSQDLLLLVLDLSGIEKRKVVRKEHLRGSCLQRHPLQLELRERYWWHLSKRDLFSWQFVQA